MMRKILTLMVVLGLMTTGQAWAQNTKKGRHVDSRKNTHADFKVNPNIAEYRRQRELILREWDDEIFNKLHHKSDVSRATHKKELRKKYLAKIDALRAKYPDVAVKKDDIDERIDHPDFGVHDHKKLDPTYRDRANHEKDAVRDRIYHEKDAVRDRIYHEKDSIRDRVNREKDSLKRHKKKKHKKRAHDHKKRYKKAHR